MAPIKILVTGADTGPAAGRSRIASSVPRKQTTFPRLPYRSWNLGIVNDICGAESPEPLGLISTQLQPQVLLEEDDCQYSQEILERQGGRPGRSRNRRHHS